MNAVATPVSWALIHSLWQGALVAAALAVALAFLRRRSARIRYATACGALLALLVLTVGTALRLATHLAEPGVPASPLPVLEAAGVDATTTGPEFVPAGAVPRGSSSATSLPPAAGWRNRSGTRGSATRRCRSTPPPRRPPGPAGRSLTCAPRPITVGRWSPS